MYEAAIKQGIDFVPGVNDRIPGWMQVHYRFAFDRIGKAQMYFFNTCKAAIRTLPLMMYDEHKPEDLDTKLEDHVADEIRYFCMTRPLKPIEIKEETKIAFDPLNMMKGAK